MPLSNSVLRRYTAPTCTLQIEALNSPSSRWRERAVSALSRFELSFDAPQLPEAERVNIQGRSDQLEALHEAVTTYVQDLLKQSPDQFNAILWKLTSPSPDATETRLGDLSVGDSQAVSEEPRPLDSSDAFAKTDLEQIAPKDRTVTPTGEIFLQPGRGLSHDLFLGTLATEETKPVIHLSVLQVFDLATVLDEYAADVVSLPTLNRPRLVPSAPHVDWASIAAMLLLAVGLTTVVQIINRSDSEQQTAQSNPNAGSSSNYQEPIALEPSPLPPLSSPETLPSPPPVGSIVPSPIPSLPSVNVPGTTPALKGAVEGTALPQNPALKATTQVKAPQTSPFTSGTRQETAPQAIPVNPSPAITPPPPILINPLPNPDSSVSIPGEAAAPRTRGAPTPSSPVALPSAAIPSPSPQLTPFNSDLQATLSEATRDVAPQESTQARSRSTPNTPNEPKATALNTVPQVAEVRDYFNRRWEPPSSLNQPLEYSLLVSVDGTIEEIQPLGQAARNYVDRTGMPLIGESFVSPSRNGQAPRIRVVLNPDGKVQSFLESADESRVEPQPVRTPPRNF